MAFRHRAGRVLFPAFSYVMVMALLSWAGMLPVVPAQAAGVGSFPRPVGYVNDFAGVMDAGGKQALESELAAFAARTGSQVAVAVVDSVAPYDSKTYAVKLFEAWGIGKKGRDDGVLLLAAVAERRVEIEVGYGAEGRLTDGKAGEILDRDVIPYLKAGDWSAGLTAGARAIMAVLDGTTSNSGGPVDDGGGQASHDGRGREGWSPWEWAAFIFVLVVLAMIIAGERGGRGPRGPSGGGSGGGRSSGFESLPGSRRRTGGGWFGFPGPGGGGHGGGGGFGGFGGGRSGGGGAGRGF